MNKQEILNKINSAETSISNAEDQLDSANLHLAEAKALLNESTSNTITFGNPERVGVLLANAYGNVLCEPYTGLEHLSDGKYRMWYMWDKLMSDGSMKKYHLSCISPSATPGSFTGANVQNPDGNYKQGYGGITAKKFKGDYYHCYNSLPQNGKVKKRFFASNNGYSWGEYVLPSELWLGEDHSLMPYKDSNGNEKLAMFARPFIPNQPGLKREISILFSDEGVTWTEPESIFKPLSFVNEHEFYSMTACQIKPDLFVACINRYKKSSEEVYMELWTSADLYDWDYVKNIPNPDFKQSYGQISYDESRKEINILTSESKSDHGKSDKGFFQIGRFKMKVEGV